MRGLSLMQPWASLVALGAKRVETRSWPTRYKGPVAIHASRNFPGWAKSLLFNQKIPAFTEALRAAGYSYADLMLACSPRIEVLPLGKILAVADLVDCHLITGVSLPPEPERSFGDYTEGRWAWYLDNVRRLPEPVPARGALGLWQLPPEVLEAVQAQLAGGVAG